MMLKHVGKKAVESVVIPYALGFGQGYIKANDKTVLGLPVSEWYPIILVAGGAASMLVTKKGRGVEHGVVAAGAALLGERTEGMVMGKINKMVIFRKIMRKSAPAGQSQVYDSGFVASPVGFYS